MADTIEEFIAALNFKADTTPLTEAEKKAKEAAEKSSKAWEKFGSTIRNVGAIALGAGGGLLALVERSAASAAKIDDLAKRTGAATRDLQRLGFAAQQSGSSMEVVADALRNLDRALVKGAKDSGPAAEALRALGLTTTELIDLPAEAKFNRIADAIAKVENPALQTKIAMDLFGGAGAELVPVLDEGSAGIKALGDQAEKLGIVLGDDAVKAAADFDDQMGALKGQLAAVGRNIGLEMLPVIQSMIKHWREWGVAVGAFGVALAGLKLVQLPGQIGLAANSMATLAARTAGATTAALALGVALGTALDQALGLSDALAGVNQEQGSRQAAFLGALTEDERTRLEAATARRDRANEQAQGLAGGSAFGDLARADAAAAQREIDAIQAGAAGRQRGSEGLGSSREGVTKFVERGKGEAAIERGLKANERGLEIGKKAFAKSQKKGGAKKKFEEDITAAMFEFDDAHGDELRMLAKRFGLGEIAIDAALKAGAESLTSGSTDFIARNAALGALGSRAGVDLTTKREKDPLLSQIFGDTNVPDVELSSIARGAEPQVLISNITNNFEFSIDQNIAGAGDPVAVGDRSAQAIRDYFQGSLAAATKTAKVNFAR